MSPLVRHLPGQKRGDVGWGLAAMGGTGVEERAQPMAGIQAPQHDCLENAKHRRGEVCTPDAA